MLDNIGQYLTSNISFKKMISASHYFKYTVSLQKVTSRPVVLYKHAWA